MLIAFSRGPRGFRELLEADRNHFHLSWCLSARGDEYAEKLMVVKMFRFCKEWDSKTQVERLK